MISDTIKYVKCCFKIIKPQHKDVDDVILKSALVYQYLYLNHYDVMLPIDDVLELNNNEIGLIGPGNGCLTHILERIFNRSDILHSHSILHDAFGRFYAHNSLDRGYTYVIPENKTPRWVKKISIMWSSFRVDILSTEKNNNMNNIYERIQKKHIQLEPHFR